MRWRACTGTAGPDCWPGWPRWRHHTTIELPLPQEELASLVSAPRATVTRALRDWRQRRLVETSPRHITIIDHAALARIAVLRP